MTPPSWPDMFRVFGRIGLMSFGGPAAQIAVMHRELVEHRPWLSEQTYLRALSLCMLLPGPEAMQLATYAGWRRGVRAGWEGCFRRAGCGLHRSTRAALCVVWADAFGATFLLGIKAAVIIVVFQALLKVSSKALHGRLGWALAFGSFIALFVLGLPFPLIILVAGAIGMLSRSPTPETEAADLPPAHSLRTLLIWGGLWAAPLLFLASIGYDFLLQLGLFFSKLADDLRRGLCGAGLYDPAVVQDFGWIATDQMIDALGLAETTPGPLILVTQFVGMLAGFFKSGPAGRWLPGCWRFGSLSRPVSCGFSLRAVS